MAASHMLQLSGWDSNLLNLLAPQCIYNVPISCNTFCSTAHILSERVQIIKIYYHPMSAPLGPPPAGGDQDRGPGLIGMFWTECALAMIIVGLRFYARISIRNLGADDWMMLFTVVSSIRVLETSPTSRIDSLQFLFLVMTCFVTYYASIGGSRHLYYLTPEQTLQAVKWSWVAQPWGIFLFATGKASVAILVLRIMGKTSFRRSWVLYAVIISVFIVNSLGCIFTFVQCDPPRALWTPSIQGHCWNPDVQEHFNYFLSGTAYPSQLD